MARRKNGEQWVDAFLPLLQKQIHSLQDERTKLLREIEPLQARVKAIEYDLEIMEAERTLRTQERPAFTVPDFPVEAPAKPDPEPEPEVEIEVNPDPGDFFDNSSFCVPGHTIFGPYAGIHAHVKTTAYKNATRRVVRDWVVNWGDDWFMPGAIVQDTGFSSNVVLKRLVELKDQGVTEHNGKRQGGSRWRYNSKLPKGPTSRPRHDKPTTRGRSAPVAHVRPVGPSGKQGENKKRAAKGMKVKRKRQGT